MAKQAVRYWLMKSEPDVFSIDDLARDGTTPWEGVRNYQARNHMRSMSVGDLILFYHSSTTPPGVAGIGRVSREAYPDKTQFDPESEYFDPKSTKDDPRWSNVDVEMVEMLARLVTLEEIKTDAKLESMLVRRRGMRLSVQPVEKAHFEHVIALSKKKPAAT
jgi:predicted RNA-binding protein with PUA-like domain